MIKTKYQPHLADDETIIWEKRIISNKLKKHLISLVILLFMIFSIYLFALILWIWQSQSDGSDMPLTRNGALIVIIVVIVLSIPMWYFYSQEYTHLRKILITFNIKPRNLQEFEEIYILTNKKWVQKSIFFGYLDLFKELKGKVGFSKGFATVPLEEFEVLYSKPGFRKKAQIENFHMIWNEREKDSIFTFSLSNEEHGEFMEKIAQAFQVAEEKHDCFKKGDIFYALKQK